MTKSERYKPDFPKLRKKIKRENKNKQCWSCKHFDGYYFDGITFDCRVLGDNQMWQFEGDNCRHHDKE